MRRLGWTTGAVVLLTLAGAPPASAGMLLLEPDDRSAAPSDLPDSVDKALEATAEIPSSIEFRAPAADAKLRPLPVVETVRLTLAEEGDLPRWSDGDVGDGSAPEDLMRALDSMKQGVLVDVDHWPPPRR